MHDIAEQVQRWHDESRLVHVARLVESRGFSSRERAAAAAWTDGGEIVGSQVLLAVQDQLARATRGASGASPSADAYGHLIEVRIDDQLAAGVGLACGGTAQVLIEDTSTLPDELWSRLVLREPVCLTTEIHAGRCAPTELFTPSTIQSRYGPDVARLFARGTSDTTVVSAEPKILVTAYWPVPFLLVVGDGLIADALVQAAALLQWRAEATNEVGLAVNAAAGLTRADAIVVLSHQRDVDGPALAAALSSNAGYVGALGSRRTQAARATWLGERGVDETAAATIHGPAGLDIGAHTPGEIAVSIVAEILATRSRSAGGALRDREGPVHLTGVQAPPPRHPHG